MKTCRSKWHCKFATAGYNKYVSNQLSLSETALGIWLELGTKHQSPRSPIRWVPLQTGSPISTSVLAMLRWLIKSVQWQTNPSRLLKLSGSRWMAGSSSSDCSRDLQSGCHSAFAEYPEIDGWFFTWWRQPRELKRRASQVSGFFEWMQTVHEFATNWDRHSGQDLRAPPS